MKLRLLIVDDDVVMRTRIRTMLDWEDHGFIICGEAINGLNAIELIDIAPPDVIITDMSMPIMDGIKLIEHIEEKYPKIKIIALSGYDDFDYVRQSLKRGALDYILKHKLNPKMILDVLDIARKSILDEKNEIEQTSSANKKLTSAKSILSHEFIIRLINGELTDYEEIKQSIKDLETPINLKNLIIVSVEIDDYSLTIENSHTKEKNKLIKAFLDISKSILNESSKAVIEYIDKGAFVIVFSLDNTYSSMYVYSKIFSDLNRIKTSIKRYLNITASFGISKVCGYIQDISKYYNESKAVLKDKFYKGKDKIFNDDTAQKTYEANFALDLKEENKMILQIKFLEKQKVQQHINEIFDKISNNRVNYQSAQMVVAELINIARKEAKDAGIDISKMSLDSSTTYSILQKYDTIADIKQWVLDIFDKLIDVLKEKNIQTSYSAITNKAIDYINKNYQNSISLNDVAQDIGINSSYLSHTFKEDTKKGFVEYLNSLRIEKAKILIENSNTSLKDIVKILGFNSYNYFFKIFKEYMAMTPLEYEESLKTNEQHSI